MSSEVLLELSENVFKIIVPGNNANQVVVNLLSKLIFINSSDGGIQKCLDFSKQRRKILDCVYNEKYGFSVLIFEGLGCVTISDNCTNIDSIIIGNNTSWPHQPLNIISLEDNGYALICEMGIIYHILIMQNEEIVIGQRAMDIPLTPNIITSCYTQNCLIVAAAASLPDDVINIFLWRIGSQADVTSTRILNYKHAHNITTTITKDEKLQFMTGHQGNDCFSLFFVNAQGCIRWLKLAFDGRILFNKQLNNLQSLSSNKYPLHITALEGKVAIVFVDMVVVYCSTYGVEISSIKLQNDITVPALKNLSKPSTLANSSKGKQRTQPLPPIALWAASNPLSGTSGTGGSYWLWFCVPGVAGAQVLRRLHISAEQQISSFSTSSSSSSSVCLLSAIGRAAVHDQESSPCESSVLTPILVGGQKDGPRLGNGVVSGLGVVEATTKPIIKQIALLKSLFEEQLGKSSVQRIDGAVDGGDGYEWGGREGEMKLLGTRKRRRVLADSLLPMDAIEPFLEQFVTAYNRGGADAGAVTMTASDAEALQLLLRTNTVSLARFPSLLDIVIESKRLELMVDLVQFVADLTERDAVNMLVLAAAVSQEGSNTTRNGSILHHTTLDSNSSLQVVHGVEESGSTSKRSSGKKKKAVAAQVDTDKNKPKEGQSSMSSNFDDSVSPLSTVILVLKAILMRNGAFSPIVLVDAVRTFSPSFSALLLRLLVHIVQSSSEDSIDCSADQLGTVYVDSDTVLCRAVTWMEALLDAHFPALALNASCHTATRRSLFRALDLVSSVDLAVSELESALGLCTHIRRQMMSGLEVFNKQYSVYAVETLTL